jgi:hypothetical protein
VQPLPLSLAQTAHGGELAALDRQERFGVPQERRGPISVEVAIVAHMAG